MNTEDFEKLTDNQKMEFVTHEAARFAELVLNTVRKWKGPETVKCLGLLQASIAIHKARAFVPDVEYMATVKMFLENMQIQTDSPEKAAS